MLNSSSTSGDKTAKDPLYYKLAPLVNKKRPPNHPGHETTRSVTAASPSSTSLLYTLNHQSHLLDISSQQSSAMNVIKTELKDKIMVTRERFNQLRQRKRN